MKTPFLGSAYTSRSGFLSSETLVNLYAERNEAGDGPEPGGFFGTPGLTLLATKSGEVRGLLATEHAGYAVVGNTLYKTTDGVTYTPNAVTLPNSSGKVSMAENGLQLVIAHADGWHSLLYATNVLTNVTGAPLDSRITYQDGYIIFTRSGDTFGITGISAVTIDPLDFASAEGAPDDTIDVISDHRELWLFGTRTVEVWTNTGNADFPFERSGNAFIEHGCAARCSPAKIDNSVFWLGRDINGQGIVFRADGYQPARISTHAIEYAINGYASIDDAFGYTYQEEGHAYYVLTFPSADVTWVYDVAAGGWHRRAWRDSDGVLHRHRANGHMFYAGKHILGDWENGKIYQSDLDVYTDDGDRIYRERAWAHIENENKLVSHKSLELIAEQGVGLDSDPDFGVNAHIYLNFSDNGGHDWSNDAEDTLGLIGDYNHRTIWRQLGTTRRRVYRVWTTEPVRVALLGANLNA